MKATHPMRIVCKGSGRKTQYQFGICDTHVVQQLKRLGCEPRKSLTSIFPDSSQVPDCLIHHFVRGYFDGDGSIFIANKKNGYKAISICGTESFLKSIISVSNISASLTQPSKIHELKSKNHATCLEFREWLYRDATIFLARKRHTFYEPSDVKINRKIHWDHELISLAEAGRRVGRKGTSIYWYAKHHGLDIQEAVDRYRLLQSNSSSTS